MSANNWGQCPRCYENNMAKAEELDRIASEAYGKVSAEKFDELREQARSFRTAIVKDDKFVSSLREDWDLGILKRDFFVYYGASCSTCGFEFTFKHEEKVK